MSSAELHQWSEYYSHEPFMSDRIEVQLAQISDIIVKASGEKDTSSVDFMVSLSQEDKKKHKEEAKHKKLIEQLNNF